MIEAKRFRHGVSESEPVDPNDLDRARQGKGTLLIVDCVDFTDGELDHLAEQLPIHPLALDDLRSANQRTKLERYGDHWHVAVHSATVHGDQVTIQEVDVVFGEDWFLVV